MSENRALFVACFLLPACLSNTVALAPEAKGVTLVRESERPLHCKVLKRISGTSRSSNEASARTGAENDLRNQAAELKGNFALVENERGGPVGTSSQRDYFVGGKALLCQTEEMEEADEKAEAEAKEKEAPADAEPDQKDEDPKSKPVPKKKHK